MTSSQQASPWRGYVNQLTYGLDLTSPATDEALTELADRLIEQRSILHPVQTYHSAARAALATTEPIVAVAGQNDVIRDLLRRLLRELDARRPWPEPAYRVARASAAKIAPAPVVGRIPLSRMAVSERVNALFEPRHIGGRPADALVLNLRSGHTVTLVAPDSFTEPGIIVRADGDARSVSAALRELTGLEMQL